MMENKTKGMAISFKRLMKICPNGAIKSIVNEPIPKEMEAKAHPTPKTKPMMIFQWSARDFIVDRS